MSEQTGLDYICSDNHCDDEGILKYRPQFRSLREHDDATWALLDQVKPEDQVIFLGDSMLARKSLDKLATYKFKKILIPGNHEFDRGLTMHDLVRVYDGVHAMFKHQNYWLTHIPMHARALGPRDFNIHGHLHRESLYDKRYINVTLEATNYSLMTFEEIISPNYIPFASL